MKEQKKITKKIPSSAMARNTFNPIRNILETMNLKPNPKKKMISLSIGDPTVFGNLKPDEVVLEAVRVSLESDKNHGYGSSTGFPEARAAVAEHVSCDGAKLTEEDVVLCSGCSCALDLCISVLANPGDNILIPRPGFSVYGTLANGLSIETKEYDLLPEADWEVDLDHLDSLVDDKTRAILVNNPSNPCGSVYTADHLKKILEVADKHGLPIIADEIYDHFVFPGHKYVPIASLTTTVPVLSCGGLTKRFLVPGWRMGWITIHDRDDRLSEIRQGLKSLSQRIIGTNTVIQGALPIILKETPQSFFDNTISVIHQNAMLAYDRLKRVPGLKPVMPQGAMYMMVGIDIDMFPNFKSDVEITEALVKEVSVFCLPGKCFNINNFFRIVLTIPEKFMIEACDRIEEFFTLHANEELGQIRKRLESVNIFSIDSSSMSSGISSDEETTSGPDIKDPKTGVPSFVIPSIPKHLMSKRKPGKPAPLLRRETVSRLA